MPVISNFPSGGGSGSGGLQLKPVTNIKTVTAAGKVYVQWTDPEDLAVDGTTLAAWGGTLLVRKAGSMPVSRRDGVQVLDSKNRNAYKNQYFCDTGLSDDGTTYYYKFFPYTTAGAYTESAENEFYATPTPVLLANVTNMSAAAAGNGKLSIKWTDPASTIVNDGITVAAWAKTTVVVKKESAATSPEDSGAAYTYTSTTYNAHASTALLVSGLENGVTYYVSFFPTTADGAVNANAANRTTGTPNRLTISAVPAQSGTLTYNGYAQTPSWNNYDPGKMTLGGDTSKIDAGNYSATFTPKEDYMWPDSSTTARTVAWSIGKAAGSLNLSTDSVTLNSSTLTTNVTVTRPGDGTVTATSNNNGVASVSVTNPTGTSPVVTISHVSQTSGTAVITINVAAGTNHTAPASKTVTVNAQFLPARKTLNNTTWAEIREISDAGQGANYWAVGDTKNITINGRIGDEMFSNVSIDAFILGFNHNQAVESSGINRIDFQIGKINGRAAALTDGYYDTRNTAEGHFQMSTSNTNSGGWGSSYMRTSILGSSNSPTSPLANSFMAALPYDLRAVMKPVNKYSDNTGYGVNNAGCVTVTVDWLFLLAEYEVFGSIKGANEAEQNYQQQYTYYKNGNSSIAYDFYDTVTVVFWWLRSVQCTSSSYFCNVDEDGRNTNSLAHYSGGVRPCFSV